MMRLKSSDILIIGIMLTCLNGAFCKDDINNSNEIISDEIGKSVLAEADEAILAEAFSLLKRGAKSKAQFYRTNGKSTPDSIEIGKVSNRNLKAFNILLKLGFTSSQAADFLQNHRHQICNPKTSCNFNSKFRTIDGTCNNQKNVLWGASFTAFRRILPNAYNDGFNEPRGGRNSTLPNARLISSTVHHDKILPDAILTNMVAQFGQFVDHDLTLTPEGDKRCCGLETDVDCWPIIVFPNDTFYSARIIPQTCLDFTRSTPFCFPVKPIKGGDPIIREQMNILTAFADASNVYGSDEKRARQLRSGVGGKLRVNKGNSFLLPTVEEVEKDTNEKIEFMGKFLAGDERVNEMPALAVLHTLFVREHNRIAEQIQGRKRNWQDQRVFQEARRLVIAEWQNILYGEYLPLILGPSTMKKYNLYLGSKLDKYSQYSSNVNPTIMHAFSTAAYRFGHTLVNGIIKLVKNLLPQGEYRLRDNFFNADQILAGGGDGYNRILEGLINQPSQVYDNFVTEDLGNFLLREDKNDFGSDLIARNLQRGRDHGLPSYDNYRTYCKFPMLPSSFDSIPQPPIFTNGTWNQLKSIYGSPKDIDLFTGGLTEERSIPGALTGPTFNCIKAIQFYNIKAGDRFFFTHKGQKGSFTPAQLKHLRQRKFSDLICDNSNLESVPIDVFKMVPNNPNNSRMVCDPKKSKKRFFLNVALFLN